MKPRRLLVSVLVPIAMAGSYPAGDLNAQKVKGIKPGKTYTSPLKNFEVVAPDLCLGTKYQEQNDQVRGMISFFGDAGQVDRIDYERMDPGFATALPQSDSAARFGHYEEHLNSTLIQPNGGRLLLKESLTLDQGEALFALIQFPRGGTAQTGTMRDGELVVEETASERGLMVLVKGAFFYVLHHDLGRRELLGLCAGSRRARPESTPEERSRLQKEALQEFYATIRFK